MEGYDLPVEQIVSDIDGGTFNATLPDSNATVGGTPTINQSPFDPKMVIPYKANGKEISEPLETVIQRASMGYNYAQLVNQHKQAQAELEQRYKQAQEIESRWKPFEEYATQNPQWADHVRQSWDARFNQQNGTQQSQQFDTSLGANQNALPPEVMQKINELDQFKRQYQIEKETAHRAEQDAALNSEIGTIQSQHPDIDLKATDPATGESLEIQILRHAQQNGINSFRAAFRDMMFDQLVAKGQTTAKEQALKHVQNAAKNGFLAQSNTPMLQNDTRSINLKNQSYDSLMDLAIRELGI